MLNSISGKDELIYHSASETDHSEIGSCSFQLQIASKSLKPVLKISVNIKYTINDIVRTTDIISNLTPQAKLIEQHYEKHIKAKYHLLREMNVVLQDDGLMLSLNYFIDGRVNMQSIYLIPSHALGGFVPSAFNILLLKLLARIGIPKNQMNFIGMDSCYNVCPVIFTNLPRTKLNVNDIWVDAITIERKIIGKHGDSLTRYFLDESGNLLMLMKFEEELYGIAAGVKHTKPVLESFFEDNKIKRKFDWEKDLEMTSKFQYLKEKNKGELLKYCYKNPYWKSIIADFLQQLLIDKPTDALSYTANYFNNFTSSDYEGSQKSLDLNQTKINQ